MLDTMINVEATDRLKNIEEILRDLTTGNMIDSATIVTIDGLPIASILGKDIDEDKIAAMSAASLSLTERVLSTLDRGNVGRLIMEGEKGLVIIMNAGTETCLTCTTRNTKLGLVLLDMKKAITKLEMFL